MVEEENLKAMKISKIWTLRKKNFTFCMPFFSNQNNSKKIYKISKRYDSQYRRMMLAPVKNSEERKYLSYNKYLENMNENFKKSGNYLEHNSSFEKAIY